MAYLINSPRHFITSDHKTERPYTSMMLDCKGIVSRLSFSQMIAVTIELAMLQY